MKSILAALALFVANMVYAQKNELWVNANAGLFHFNGKSAESTGSLIYALDGTMAYTSAEYGKKNGVGYGVSLSSQHVTKYRLIYGLEAGYEHFASKVKLEGGGYTSSMYTSYLKMTDVSGKGMANFDFINTHPYVGYRFACKKIKVDITGGFDIAIATKASYKINADATQKVKMTNEMKTPGTDIRPRLQATVIYKCFGIYGGYSWGVRNYMERYIGGNPEAYARIFRFGLSYQLL